MDNTLLLSCNKIVNGGLMGIELDLELPDVEILKVSRDSKGNYVIDLRSTKKSGVCRK